MEKFVKYSNPGDQEDKRYGINYSRNHKFNLVTEENVIVSGAQAKYLSKPLPHYYIDGVYTDKEHQSQGYASDVLTEVESFLKERGKPGLLVDGIRSEYAGVYGMYERRGWVPISGTNLLAYNLSPSIDSKIFMGYAKMYTWISQRKTNS